MKKNDLYRLILLSLCATVILNGCSKSAGEPSTPADPCAGITITVTATATEADAGSSNGSITATASGSSGLSFTINSGATQSSGTFINLAAGTYTIISRNSNGCSGTAKVIVPTRNACAGTPGPLFLAVQTLISNNCAVTGCHNGSQAPNFTVACTIVAYAELIRQRAVEQAATATQMPQLPRAALIQTDRDKITAWISAGKRYTD